MKKDIEKVRMMAINLQKKYTIKDIIKDTDGKRFRIYANPTALGLKPDEYIYDGQPSVIYDPEHPELCSSKIQAFMTEWITLWRNCKGVKQ